MNTENIDLINLCNNIAINAKGSDIDQALLTIKKHLLEYADKNDAPYNQACGIYAGLKVVKLQQDPASNSGIQTLGDLRRAVEHELSV